MNETSFNQKINANLIKAYNAAKAKVMKLPKLAKEVLQGLKDKAASPSNNGASLCVMYDACNTIADVNRDVTPGVVNFLEEMSQSDRNSAESRDFLFNVAEDIHHRTPEHLNKDRLERFRATAQKPSDLIRAMNQGQSGQGSNDGFSSKYGVPCGGQSASDNGFSSKYGTPCGTQMKSR